MHSNQHRYVCLHFEDPRRRSDGVSLQSGLDLLINDPANQINNPTSVDRVCVYRVTARRPVPSFSGTIPAFQCFSPRPPLWTQKKTWFIFGPRQSSSIRSFLTVRLTFPRPKSNARSGAMLKKSSSLSSSGLKKLRSERRNEGSGGTRRGEERNLEEKRTCLAVWL